jgi:tryptophan halogenase
MIKSICILGGGTSGLVSALILNKWYPTMDITIVESANIGIVGVGEGSTEHWARFMQTVGITHKELMLETGATFKSGIRFENWNGDGKFYMHSLHADFTQTLGNGLPGVMLKMLLNGEEHLHPDNILQSIHYVPIEASVNQYHFDTYKLNTFLHKKCTERGVKIVEDDISKVVISENGFVNSLVGEKGTYSAEFFIDCSGFKRVISSKLGAKWIDYKKYLPMDSAFAFPTPGDEDIPSWTLSKAMSSGWLWRIPTQERYGNGYVFSSEFLTEEQAQAEVRSIYTDEVEIRKSFKFAAGHVDQFWINNCVTLGLSGSFVEPLEASSIGTSIQQSFLLGQSLLTWEPGDTTTVKSYNAEFTRVAKNIIDFVQLHYITKRQDTEFWRFCKTLPLTDFNQETLEFFKGVVPSRLHFQGQWLLFSELNWLQVMHGLKLFDHSKLEQIWNRQDPKFIAETDRIIEHLKVYQQNNVAFSHRKAIEFLAKNTNLS